MKKREREKGRVDDVVGWDKLAAVSFETAPRGPLRRVTPHGRRKVIPTYLPIPRLHFRRRNKGRRHGRHPSPRPNASCFSPFLGVRARDHRFLSSRLLSRFSLSLSRVFFCFSRVIVFLMVFSPFFFFRPFLHFDFSFFFWLLN